MEKENNKKDIFTPNRNNKKGFNPKFNFYWIYLSIAILFLLSIFLDKNGFTREISYSKFEALVADNCISKITVFSNRNQLEAEVKTPCMEQVFGEKIDTLTTKALIEVSIPSVEEFEKMIAKYRNDGVYTGEYRYEQARSYEDIIWSVVPFLLMLFFFMFIMRRMSSSAAGGGGIFSVGKSQAKLFDKGTSEKVTFKDVAGLGGAKQEVEEIVSFLKDPEKYRRLGGKIPKGALLVGPPGTGKTLLAKAVAGEADVPFFSMSGSDFVEMFVGVGASRVRDLFRQAKEKAPCIIFIDEIDAIGRARGKNISHSNDERENTLNQLLTEMDGFGTNSGVIILAATNRAEILDKALLRAGRFDRQIHVELPDLNERKAIFQVHLLPLKIDKTLDVDFLARQTPGFSGAEIANVCNEAALIAARNNKDLVEKEDFLAAVDRIIGGLEKKTKIITQEEKKSIAYHEAGHATISWLLEYANPLVKVTIVPRGEALGAAWYLPEERQLTTKEHILDEMCATLGGRAAEEVFFGTMSTGAMNDLERVTKRAYAMVTYFGMSDKVKNMSFYDSTGNDYNFTKPYSEKTAELIDEEAKKIIAEQYQRAKELLETHREGHNRLAELLVEREVIFAEDVEAVFGKRPWKSRTEELLQNTEQPSAEEDVTESQN